MKESEKTTEKTKRISIATVLFILVILIGFLSYKRPKFMYTITPQTAAENIVANDFLISLNDLPASDYALIDIRSSFEFQKGHMETAINMQAPEILSKENTKILDKLISENKTVILYGSTPNEALSPYMVLSQIGYNNLKLLTIKTSYFENKLITTNVAIEKPVADVNAFIAASIKKAQVKKVKPIKVKTPPPPKKVIPVKKKKRMPAEGGC